jgi:hypothetical protein
MLRKVLRSGLVPGLYQPNLEFLNEPSFYRT